MSSLFRRTAGALLTLLGLASAPHAFADTTCVSTAAALQAALAAAQTNNADDYIKVVVGNYSLAASSSTYVSDNHALIVEGGYAGGCGSMTAVPDTTVITGANGLFFRLISTGGGLTVRNFTLTGFKPAAGTNAIVFGEAEASATLRLENLAISGNGVNGINDSIVLVYANAGLIFDNNIVHDNTNADATVKITASYPGQPITIANNTIAKNIGTGLYLDVYTILSLNLTNNVLWNPGTTDLNVFYASQEGAPLALNNVWLNCLGCGSLAFASANNSTADPKLTATFRLGATSPAINTGMPVPMALPALDAAGNARSVGSAPDRGAYETATNDLASTTYLVTSTNDDASILSLRGAITAANAAGVPARINFHFSAGCPQVIVLNSPLPAIKVPLIIDGYSHPGSAPNSSGSVPSGALPFNAILCATVFGKIGSPQVASALSVPDTADPKVHVEVRGLRFQNFATAIDLSGGNGHWIHGNAFIGPFFAGLLGNGVGVQIDAGFNDVIGGPSAADVNLIGGSSGEAGVLISGGVNQLTNGLHVVRNNSIGGDLAGDGGTTYGNAHDGIKVKSTRQVRIESNWIIANGGDGVRNDGSAYITTKTNSIGDGGLGNAGAGVHMLNGANKNWIGAITPQIYGDGNRIVGNTGPGVWIDDTAGLYNMVEDNAIYNNGGLAIDLAALGPSANSGNEDTGANHLLHKPTLSGVVLGPGNTIKVSGVVQTAASNAYRYVTLYANSKCGGEATTHLITYIQQANASGVINLNLSIPAPGFAPAFITASVDDYTAGVKDTSEISNSKRVSPSDDLFNDSFDCY